jgi:hypothetical protein
MTFLYTFLPDNDPQGLKHVKILSQNKECFYRESSCVDYFTLGTYLSFASTPN